MNLESKGVDIPVVSVGDVDLEGVDGNTLALVEVTARVAVLPGQGGQPVCEVPVVLHRLPAVVELV